MAAIALRCAWCHDDALPGAARCAGCGTVVHVECLGALQGCTTIGCGEAPRPPRASRMLSAAVSVAIDAGLVLVLATLTCACLLAMTKQIVGSF